MSVRNIVKSIQDVMRQDTGVDGDAQRISQLCWMFFLPGGQKAYSMMKPIRLEHLQPCIDWWGGLERQGRVESEVAWRVTADAVKARGYNLDIKNPHVVADEHGDPEELLAKLESAEQQVATLRDQLKAILADALLR